MQGSLTPLRGFARELRRRGVAKVAATYAAIGFATAQAADLFFPHLGLPAWTVRAVLLLVIFGFPFALALAWAYDVVPDQPSTPGDDAAAAPRRLRTGAAWQVLAAGALVVAAALFVAARGVREANAGSGMQRERVVVAALENRTLSDAHGPIGALAADWITQSLAQSGLIDVVPAAAAYITAAAIADRGANTGADAVARAGALARETNAGTLVWGAYYREGEHILLHVFISDARRGELIRRIEPVRAPADSMAAAVAQLGRRVAGALATVLNPRLSSWIGSAGDPPSLEAYQAYSAGMDAYVRYRYDDAVRSFEQAVALDPSFTIASVWLAHTLANGIDRARADVLAAALLEGPDRLSPYDRAFVERLRARLRGDHAAAYAAAKRMTEIAPGSDDAWRERGLDALRLNRPDEMLEIFRRLDPDRGWLRGYADYWTWRAQAAHLLGRHREELRAAREGLRRYPDWPWLRLSEALALAALRRTGELEQAITRVGPSPQPLMALGAELHRHGYAELARAVFVRAVESARAEQRATPSTSNALMLLEALYYAGVPAEAETLGGELLPGLEPADAVLVEGVLGAVAARRGNDAAARVWSERLAARNDALLAGRPAYWRARIAALIGDTDEALALLDAALREGLQPVRSTSGGPVPPHSAPEFAGLRGTSAFERVMTHLR